LAFAVVLVYFEIAASTRQFDDLAARLLRGAKIAANVEQLDCHPIEDVNNVRM
jgi:hypothetical protein